LQELLSITENSFIRTAKETFLAIDATAKGSISRQELFDTIKKFSPDITE
jgi:Ca2+-binding EF-hand superfamily protein